MNGLLKTLLLWLLVAVLPLQTVGATVSLPCGPVHHQAMKVASAGDGHRQDSAETEQAPHQDVSSCSSCASGCIGAGAPPSTIISRVAVDGAQMITVSPAPLVAGYTPSGLERPPKHLPA